jgi:hypothetical protein
MTEPRTLSTALTPVAGISVATVRAALDRVRRSFQAEE